MAWETATILGLLGVNWFLTSFEDRLNEEEFFWLKIFIFLFNIPLMAMVLFVTQQIAALNDAGVASVISGIFRAFIIFLIFTTFVYLVIQIKRKNKLFQDAARDGGL